ncbi:hypothetical protein GGF46_001017 [Coemansia sp. RSA 552]|nr:hypothetical protein GGF46_001017 [Coemansia sp. RSA 552]
MDLTLGFRELAREAAKGAQVPVPAPRRVDFTRPAQNAFLSEAYIIAKHLHSLHQRLVELQPAYLNLPGRSRALRSTIRTAGAKLSDPERDEIDNGIKAAVRQMLAKIKSLNELGEALLDNINEDEGARELLRRLVGALDPRKAGNPSGGSQVLGKRDTVAALQSSVVWWLNARLRQANQLHAEMQEQYLRQKLDRQRGLLAQQQRKRKQASQAAHAESRQPPEDDELLQTLSQQQLQQLQEENRTMADHFEGMLDSIRDTQRSVAEISALQTQLANELNSQMQQTEQIYNEAVGAADNVDHGNQYLVSAGKNQASARKWTLFVFVTLSVVLLFLDWFD